MTESELTKSLKEAFEEAGLSRYVLRDRSQLFEDPDDPRGFFVEIVLSDGSKLDKAKKLIELIRRDMEAHGSHLDSIVRAIWSVKKVEYVGPSRGESGGIRSADDFSGILESGERTVEVTVEVTGPALGRLKEKLGDDHVREAVADFIRLQLSWGGAGYWDPVGYPRQVLNEAAVAYLLSHRPVAAA